VKSLSLRAVDYIIYVRERSLGAKGKNSLYSIFPSTYLCSAASERARDQVAAAAPVHTHANAITEFSLTRDERAPWNYGMKNKYLLKRDKINTRL
jgi:hypothetical protein